MCPRSTLRCCWSMQAPARTRGTHRDVLSLERHDAEDKRSGDEGARTQGARQRHTHTAHKGHEQKGRDARRLTIQHHSITATKRCDTRL